MPTKTGTVADGRAVANFVLDFCEKQGRAVTHLSLQKIVYFCHVWSLIVLRKPLVRHRFEAWQFGPVLQYLYREFRQWNDNPITGRAHEIDLASGEKEIVTYKFDKETTALLSNVVDFYSRLQPSELVALAHADGSPWHEAWNHSDTVNPGMRIDDSSIVDYYSKAPKPFLLQ